MTAAHALTVRSIDVRPLDRGEELTILWSHPVDPVYFTLDSPDRLVVDSALFEWKVDNSDLAKTESSLIHRIRYARHDAKTSRIVMDLTGAVKVEKIEQNRRAKLVLRLSPRSVTVPARLPTKKIKAIKPSVPKPAVMTALPSSMASSKAYKPLIYIDAGHGGQDPGAIGRSKTKEKFVTLRYAKALRDALRKTGKFRAELTRDEDKFILLRERFRIARRAKADLFLSLHADSAPNSKARGLSIYTLSEKASDAEAAALAKQENKVDVLADMDLSHEDEEVAGILIDLARRETKNKSVRLAESIVKSVKGKARLLTNPHRHAGFAVLKAPDIPSVLIELGFLTNREEEKLLNTKAYQRRVVEGLVDGVEAYFDSGSTGE